MKSLRVLPIASGSSGNCFALELGDYHILIDMGISCKRTREALLANDIDISDIDIAFLTHGHSDHINGLKVVSKNLKCDIFATKDTINFLNEYDLKEIKCGVKKEILPKLYVEAFATSHDIEGSCGFVFEYMNIKVGYATDLGYVSEKIKQKLKASDLIVIEANHNVDMLINGPYTPNLKDRILSKCGHLSNNDCGLAINELAKKGTKHFLLAHLSKENNTPEQALIDIREVVRNEDIDIKVLPIYSKEIIDYFI